MRQSGKRWATAVAALVLLLALVALTVALGRPGEAQGSTLSHGPGGWLAARRYLEARGAEVTLWREPLGRFAGSGTLVVAFPWQHGASPEAAEALEDHLRRGGDLVLAYSGNLGNPGELLALEGLGLSLAELRRAPLGPWAWRRFAREEWDLLPAVSEQRAGKAAALRIWAPRAAPALPETVEALYLDPSGRPAVARLRRYRGAIWFLPADTLANARLGGAGNADLLETLLARLGPRWTFDEYHHGLVAAGALAGEAPTWTLDLALVHLAVLYGLAVLTLARRFGPPWREPPVVTGSVGSFLLGLGALHHRLGHHGEAARRLLERVRDLAPGLALPEDLARRAATAGPRDLVGVARAIVRLRRGQPPASPGDRE